MNDGLLFGYSVEENDGKFVITLAGKLALPIMQDIAAQVTNEPGSAGSVTRLFPYSLLASQAVRLMQQPAGNGVDREETSLEDIFGQGFDRDLDDFERQLDRYQNMLPISARGPAGAPMIVADGDEATRAKKAVVKAANP
jgi:hypothetical protein